MQRRILMKAKILDQIRGSEQGMLQLLEELVNIDSGADALAGINAVAQRIGAFLEALGFTVEYLETEGAPVQLLARKAQPGKKQVLFSGHMDTVFNQGTAAVRPFKVENGLIRVGSICLPHLIIQMRSTMLMSRWLHLSKQIPYFLHK